MGQIVFSELLYQFIIRGKPIVPGNIFKILKIVDFFSPRYLPNFDMTKDPELYWEFDKSQSFARLHLVWEVFLSGFTFWLKLDLIKSSLKKNHKTQRRIKYFQMTQMKYLSLLRSRRFDYDETFVG